MSDLYNKILKTIPSHVGELYLEHDVREQIAKAIKHELDPCSHDYSLISQVKLIEPHVCKKCGKIK